MGINEIYYKKITLCKKIDRENRSDFAKLVDRNTELVDKMNDLQETIEHLEEYVHEQEEENKKITKGVRNLEKEIWKPIKNYEGSYEVSKWCSYSHNNRSKKIRFK